MKIWVTKYALTSGVFTAEAKIDNGMASVRRGMLAEYYFGHDWHRTSAGAELQFQKMIDAKRKSITKQLKKLDALEEAGMKVSD